MKKIELKEVKVEVKTRSDQEPITNKYKYINWIRDALLDTGQQGLPFKEMRERTKILDKIDALKDATHLELEDTEFGVVKKQINAMTWRVCSNEIVEFVEYINSFEK